MYIIIKLIPIPKYIIAVQIQITYHSQWYEKDAKIQVGGKLHNSNIQIHQRKEIERKLLTWYILK